MKCANCGSTDLGHGLNTARCRSCGLLNDYDGNIVANGPGQDVQDVIARHNEPGVPTVVGNQADLQRAGADVATGEGSFETGVVVPDGAIHPADEDAAQGLITEETLRTGIHDESDLAPPDPQPNTDDAHSVDPDAKSPVTVRDAGKSAPKSGDAAAKAEAKAKADAS